jgi:hypothetical protein
MRSGLPRWYTDQSNRGELTGTFHEWTCVNVSRNERKFGSWLDLPGGGRRYFFEVKGRSGWYARYVKEVDAGETTVRFYQEVYDGKLREIHHKYPIDQGHQQVTSDES